ncbi:hypothetical protein [Amycolatopsis sp. WQ 127309]|uniref:hypothetical protein n=1 Tax=Amycolatopsis sp. WQ 127309 TaxID=2932773 RepID=UPI001FF3FB71|nr:hypothetical protein [Amycolatopsis sp. WQ 127309]UOZ05136.1 hypothetical protein MUY22_40930 [Amycolatopsis sp. WQ 127309]
MLTDPKGLDLDTGAVVDDERSGNIEVSPGPKSDWLYEVPSSAPGAENLAVGYATYS